MTELKKLWKNDYFKTAIAILLIVGVILVFLFGLQLALNTPNPALTVESSSMCIPNDRSPPYDFNYFLWTLSHPFDRTLNVGDIILVEGMNPKNLNTNYPNSDIIVFHSPDDPGILIVHRIINVTVIDGTTYFLTKGDGNGINNPWPEKPVSGLDPWDYNSPPGVPADMVVGKVILRIPWFGWITLFMRGTSWGLPLVIALIILLVVIEFIIPILREEKPDQVVLG